MPSWAYISCGETAILYQVNTFSFSFTDTPGSWDSPKEERTRELSVLPSSSRRVDGVVETDGGGDRSDVSLGVDVSRDKLRDLPAGTFPLCTYTVRESGWEEASTCSRCLGLCSGGRTPWVACRGPNVSLGGFSY